MIHFKKIFKPTKSKLILFAILSLGVIFAAFDYFRPRCLFEPEFCSSSLLQFESAWNLVQYVFILHYLLAWPVAVVTMRFLDLLNFIEPIWFVFYLLFVVMVYYYCVSCIFSYGYEKIRNNEAVFSVLKKYIFITLSSLILVGIISTFWYYWRQNPSYTSISSCSKIAQLVIEKKNLPQNQIHSCDSKKKIVDGERIYLVDIAYGPAQDCPSGCFYDHFFGIVVVEKNKIAELLSPAQSVALLYSEIPFQANQKRDYECNSSLESITTAVLAKQNNKYGWKILFKKPYECSYIKLTQTKVTYENTLIHRGNRIVKSYRGSVFVYFENRLSPYWNFDKLEVTTKIGEEVIIEEPL